RLAPKASHELARRMAGICQAGPPASAAVARASPRDCTLLWMDRWADGDQQRWMVAPALHTPSPAQQVVQDQLCGGRPFAGPGATHAGGSGAGGCRKARRPLGGCIRIPADDHHPPGFAGGPGCPAPCQEVLSGARQQEPLCDSLPIAGREESGDASAAAGEVRSYAGGGRNSASSTKCTASESLLSVTATDSPFAFGEDTQGRAT